MTWTIHTIPDFVFEDSTLSTTVRTLLAARGITSKEDAHTFLHPNYARDFHDPWLLSSMERAVERILHARDTGEKVGIFGDHDVDGISATTIMHEGLEMLEITHEAYIPCKHADGHGLNKSAIDAFADAGITLMITVDCGVGDVAMVSYAKEKGIETIITDHHQIPDALPNAYAIINPHLSDDPYPFKDLCGTAIAFKVVYALVEKVRPHEIESLKWMLDLVAIATVADCMPLSGENRTLVMYGLIVLAKTRRRSLQEMIVVGEIPITPESLPTAHTIGFHIGPRLNAAGRMGHARDAYHFLIETDPAAARIRAEDLESKNIERRKITEKLLRSTRRKIDKDHKENGTKNFIFVSDPDYPIGIVGIVAGRLTRHYNRPVGVFVDEGDTLRGSFRSVEGIDLMTILNSTKHSLEKYGGHAGAAGATLSSDQCETFIATAEQEAMRIIDALKEEPAGGERADLSITADEISEDLVDELQKLAPFGEGNHEPLLSITDLTVQSSRTVGSTDKHLKLTCKITNTDHAIDVIGFDFGKDHEKLPTGTPLIILGNLAYNEWMGNRTIQILMKDWTYTNHTKEL